MRVGVYCFMVGLLGLVLLILGLVRVFEQYDMVSRYKLSRGKVLSSGSASGSFGGYRLAVHYSYSVRGRKYESRRVTPLAITRSKSWVLGQEKEFVPDESVDVYVDPRAPSSSFLLPLTRFYPYGLILLGATILMVGPIPLVAGGVFGGRPRMEISKQHGWSRFESASTLMTHAMAPLSLALCWYLVGLIVGAHYFLGLGGPYVWLSGSMAVYAAAGLVPLIVGLRRMSLAQRFGQAGLWIMKPQAALDQPIIIRFEQLVRQTVAIDTYRLSLVCMQRQGLGDHKLFASSHHVIQQQSVAANQILGGGYRFEVPTKKRRASSPFNRWEYPRTDWYIELWIRLESGLTSYNRFPLHTVPSDEPKADASA